MAGFLSGSSHAVAVGMYLAVTRGQDGGKIACPATVVARGFRRRVGEQNKHSISVVSGSCCVIAGELNRDFDSVSSLKAGHVATIVRITATEVAAKRLADMGFVRGARIEMLRPGTPCLVRIGASCVGLGTAHQRSVLLNRHDES